MLLCYKYCLLYVLIKNVSNLDRILHFLPVNKSKDTHSLNKQPKNYILK